jgi:hypothetical protein
MKHSVMTWRKETRLSPVPPPDEGPEGCGGSAFDLWLRRGLHQLFDDIANEPVPEELLRLIEDDRAAVNGTAEKRSDGGASPEAAPGSPEDPGSPEEAPGGEAGPSTGQPGAVNRKAESDR